MFPLRLVYYMYTEKRWKFIEQILMEIFHFLLPSVLCAYNTHLLMLY